MVYIVGYTRTASRHLGRADDKPGGERLVAAPLHVGTIVDIPADSVGNSNAANASRRPIATVLVADDNRDTAETVATLLRMANYNVICTYSVQEALGVLDERPDVELVLADIRMPEYTGFDLHRVMRYRWPKVPIVLVTGFDIVESDVVPRGAVIVQKPFTFAELDTRIKEQLCMSRPSLP